MNTALIPYTDGGKEFEAFVAYPAQEKRPMVILCHAWRGRDDFICEKAKLVASWGYIGFALDMYGKGILGKNKEENAALKKPFLVNRELLQKRLLKALEAAASLSYVDSKRIAVLGYGFGGLCALDFARTGADLQGAISIYGHFEPLPTSLEKPIKAKILVFHGFNDPIVSMDSLRAFEKEMTEANVDWQAHIFSNTLHAFATPSANDPEAGLLYNPLSARRADALTRTFLTEIFT